MRTFLVRFSSTAAALLIAVAVLLASRDSPAAVAAQSHSEVARIRAHLARVEAELRSADVSQLTADQRAARAAHIEVLRSYREAGVFPHNHVVEGRRVPVFVDEHDTHCAVGFLVAQSGRADIVRRIAGSRNYATVKELADDRELAAWLETAGISLDEAARIQPWYGPIEREADPSYTTASIVATGLGGGMIAWNLLADRHRGRGTLPGVLGVGVGLGELALAGVGTALDAEPGRRIETTHILVNFGVGLLSTALGVRTLLTNRSPETQSTESASSREGVQWSVAPWRPAREGGAGMRLDLRF